MVLLCFTVVTLDCLVSGALGFFRVCGPCPLEVIDASLCGELATFSTNCVLCKDGGGGP